jgi:magnesium chelatase family protein
MAIRKYASRISGPIIDRIDIQAKILPTRSSLKMAEVGEAESSSAVADRVQAARDRQTVRLRNTSWSTNAELSGRFVRKDLPLPSDMSMVEAAVLGGTLSARGVDKVLKVAWTVADLLGADRPETDHLAAALALRLGQENLR